MKSYIYTLDKKKNGINGDPRSTISVFRIKKNILHLLKQDEQIGYKNEEQIVLDIISKVEHKQRDKLKVFRFKGDNSNIIIKGV